MRQFITRAESAMIILLACIPLFIHLPYRVNIFLSWEGAYRMSQGQLPFRDYGTPLGGMYWLIPALFFKVLGAKLFTLIEAQVFINIISGFAFRSILRSLELDKGVRFAAVLLFCVSYSFFNFWPWYNHSVIVYELVSLAFLFRGIRPEGGWAADAVDAGSHRRWLILWMAGAAFFSVCSFFTKQDGGGLALLIAGAVLFVYGLLKGRWKPLMLFGAAYVFFLLVFILPMLRWGFGYWFNHGQPPHTARVSLLDISAEFFGESQWIKFYLFLIVLLVVVRYRKWRDLRADVPRVLLVVLTLGILAEAAILAVTSYTPPDNNIFFHSFAFAGIFSLLLVLLPAGKLQPRVTVVLVAGILLWWSGVWWKYTQRLMGPILAGKSKVVSTGENVVNRDTYIIDRDTTVKDIPTEQWVECGLPSFRRITLPKPTAEGIHRILDMDLIKQYRERRKTDAGANLRVLNMSELTPLAADIPYALERNPQLPLWYHLGVGMFNRQADTFETRIRRQYYDLILFEYVPTLNNFYPFRTRDSLHANYKQVDSFMAPRRGQTQGIIEVFTRPGDSR